MLEDKAVQNVPAVQAVQIVWERSKENLRSDVLNGLNFLNNLNEFRGK